MDTERKYTDTTWKGLRLRTGSWGKYLGQREKK